MQNYGYGRIPQYETDRRYRRPMGMGLNASNPQTSKRMTNVVEDTLRPRTRLQQYVLDPIRRSTGADEYSPAQYERMMRDDNRFNRNRPNPNNFPLLDRDEFARKVPKYGAKLLAAKDASTVKQSGADPLNVAATKMGGEQLFLQAILGVKGAHTSKNSRQSHTLGDEIRAHREAVRGSSSQRMTVGEQLLDAVGGNVTEWRRARELSPAQIKAENDANYHADQAAGREAGWGEFAMGAAGALTGLAHAYLNPAKNNPVWNPPDNPPEQDYSVYDPSADYAQPGY